EIQLGVVGQPAPHRAAAGAPALARPGGDAEILSLVHRVMRLEAGTDEHVLVGTRAIGAPRDLPRARVERREPAAHAELAAAVADEDLVLDDQRRHRDRLALVDVAKLRDPLRLAALGVDRDGAAVERVEEDAPAGVRGAAVDEIAAGDALRRAERLRVVLPFDRRAGPAQIEG